MNYKQAFKAALRPYSLPNDSIELILTQNGFEKEVEFGEDYQTGREQEFYAAVIDGLSMLISLEKEKDAGSENDYDTDKIAQRITTLRRRWGIPDPEAEDEVMFIDRTEEW